MKNIYKFLPFKDNKYLMHRKISIHLTDEFDKWIFITRKAWLPLELVFWKFTSEWNPLLYGKQKQTEQMATKSYGSAAIKEIHCIAKK